MTDESERELARMKDELIEERAEMSRRLDAIESRLAAFELALARQRPHWHYVPRAGMMSNDDEHRRR